MFRPFLWNLILILLQVIQMIVWLDICKVCPSVSVPSFFPPCFVLPHIFFSLLFSVHFWMHHTCHHLFCWSQYILVYDCFKLARDRTPLGMCSCSGSAASTEVFVTKHTDSILGSAFLSIRMVCYQRKNTIVHLTPQVQWWLSQPCKTECYRKVCRRCYWRCCSLVLNISQESESLQHCYSFEESSFISLASLVTTQPLLPCSLKVESSLKAL